MGNGFFLRPENMLQRSIQERLASDKRRVTAYPLPPHPTPPPHPVPQENHTMLRAILLTDVQYF